MYLAKLLESRISSVLELVLGRNATSVVQLSRLVAWLDNLLIWAAIAAHFFARKVRFLSFPLPAEFLTV